MAFGDDVPPPGSDDFRRWARQKQNAYASKRQIDAKRVRDFYTENYGCGMVKG